LANALRFNLSFLKIKKSALRRFLVFSF